MVGVIGDNYPTQTRGVIKMVIFEVRFAVVTAISVKKETKTGWTQNNGGFIKRQNQNAKARECGFSSVHYFGCHKKALDYASDMRSIVNHALDVSFASESDIEVWVEGGMDEEFLPKSRFS